MNTYANCPRCGKFGGTTMTFLSNAGETVNSRFICPYCLDEDKAVRARLLDALKELVRVCDPGYSVSYIDNAITAIARAEGRTE